MEFIDSDMNEELEPKFDLDIEGYSYIGRGPESTGSGKGWNRSDSIFMRCVECGDLMKSTMSKSYSCSCNSMFVDADYFRFGSTKSDINILVYRRNKR